MGWIKCIRLRGAFLLSPNFSWRLWPGFPIDGHISERKLIIEFFNWAFFYRKGSPNYIASLCWVPIADEILSTNWSHLSTNIVNSASKTSDTWGMLMLIYKPCPNTGPSDITWNGHVITRPCSSTVQPSEENLTPRAQKNHSDAILNDFHKTASDKRNLN
jgi:hypothetical protein